MSRDFKFFIIALVALLLIGGNIFFAYSYFNAKAELTKTQTALSSYENNGKVLAFTKLFIAKVLKSDKEIDFDTRLKLENSIRNLNDKDILAQWQKFVASKTEVDAQIQVKSLLEMLVNKAATK